MCDHKQCREEGAPTNFLRLRIFIGKLQKRFLLFAAVGGAAHGGNFGDEEEVEVETIVADDAKEGHLAVLAVKDLEKKRCIVKLKYLTSPTYLNLRKQAEEEYGFEQTGVLVVPGRPEELHKILGGHFDDAHQSQF